MDSRGCAAPAPITKNRDSAHIPSLDGIRAIAALLVFIAHAGLEDRVPGGFGVTIFFFLSGYLITTLLRTEHATHGRINLKNFYLRRAYRIWPPMYIVLAVAAMLPYAFAPSITAGAALAQAFHLTNYYIIFFGDAHIIPDTGPMWSLAVEEHFYLLYPIALTFLLRKMTNRRASLVLAGICALVLLWRCLLVYLIRYGHEYTYLASDARFDSLLYGCILALSLNPALDKQSLVSERNWSQILIVAVALLLSTFVYRNPNFRETFRYSIQGVALLPIFYCAVRYNRWKLFAWLELPLVRGFGIITYTFYLIHLKALDVAGMIARNMLVRGCLGFVIALAFSLTMYFLVERHLAALRRRLHN